MSANAVEVCGPKVLEIRRPWWLPVSPPCGANSTSYGSSHRSMTDADAAPLIVLSSHRSGSSSVMGLLVGMGLQVGEVLPPRMDNRKGFFESMSIVHENRRILATMDRDWTCPPRA